MMIEMKENQKHTNIKQIKHAQYQTSTKGGISCLISNGRKWQNIHKHDNQYDKIHKDF